VLTVQVLGGSNLLIRISSLSDELIRCQSNYGDYSCPYDVVVMSGGDEMNPNTRVPVARRMWSYLILSGIKWSRHPRARLSGYLPNTGDPGAWLPRAWA
jgi:hypothetical protein